MITADVWGATDSATLIAVTITAMVALLTLWLQGSRRERARRRQLYADALAAVLAYGEFPYAIKRRRCEPEARSAERVRLSEELRLVQSDLARYEQLLATERSEEVATAYRQLIEQTRQIAGGYMREAWRAEPISSDAEMNLDQQLDYSDLLRPQRNYREAIERDLRTWLPWSPRR